MELSKAECTDGDASLRCVPAPTKQRTARITRKRPPVPTSDRLTRGMVAHMVAHAAQTMSAGVIGKAGEGVSCEDAVESATATATAAENLMLKVKTLGSKTKCRGAPRRVGETPGCATGGADRKRARVADNVKAGNDISGELRSELVPSPPTKRRRVTGTSTTP